LTCFGLTCLCELVDEVQDKVADHLSIVHNKFKSCFPKPGRNDLSVVKHPFRASIEHVDELRDELQ